MSNERIVLLVFSSVGGTLAGFSIGEGFGLIMPFALALLWGSISIPSLGFFWGLLAVLVSHRWLLDLHPLEWMGVPSALSFPITLFIWMLCGVVGGMLIGGWTFLAHKIRPIKNASFKNKIFNALILASLWGLAENLLAEWPLFWVGIGTSVLPGDRWLAGLARLIGSGGLACVQLLIGWWIWQLVITYRRKIVWKRLFCWGISLLLIAHIIGWNLLSKDMNSESISVAMWQTNIPIREKFSNKQIDRLPQSVQRALSQANELGASFLLAPEGTLTKDQELIAPAPISFLTGGFRWVKNQQRSSLLIFNKGKKKYEEAIDKYRLVPLGEWVPDFHGFSWRGLSAVGGLHSGDPSRKLIWNGPSVAAAICYEISDGRAVSKAVNAGSEWILALANLDPYPKLLQRQFLALSQLRSIENSRDLITVANTGPTSLINSSGKIQVLFPSYQEKIGLVELHLRQGKTGYMILGQFPLLVFLLIGFVGQYFPIDRK